MEVNTTRNPWKNHLSASQILGTYRLKIFPKGQNQQSGRYRRSEIIGMNPTSKYLILPGKYRRNAQFKHLERVGQSKNPFVAQKKSIIRISDAADGTLDA